MKCYNECMKIEIDQSGKLENTHISTVVGFANSKTKSIIILSREKIKLQKWFRATGKRKMYIYNTFAALIFLLTKSEKSIESMTIDTEYPGQASLIKNYLLNFYKLSKTDIGKYQINFQRIGKSSRAHGVANSAFKEKRAIIKVSADDIIKLIKKRSGI